MSNIDIKTYQEFCQQKHQKNIGIDALGLAGEAGEVVDIIKKSLRDRQQPNLEHLIEEIGDVIWYLANIASYYELDLNDIIRYNVNKLIKRYDIKFNKEI